MTTKATGFKAFAIKTEESATTPSTESNTDPKKDETEPTPKSTPA